MRPTRMTPQRGAVALALVAALLFAMGLALVWSGGALVFTQRAAANQSRHAVAFSLAESGLASAEARLNDTRAIDDDCRPVEAGRSFRDRYAGPWIDSTAQRDAADAASGYAPPIGWRALCRLEADDVVCRCPDATPGAREAATDDTHAGPRFSIELVAVDGEPRSLWIVARGCSGTWGDCLEPGSAHAEAQAAVRAQLRLVESGDASDPAAVLQHAPLAMAPGSWRDGRCLGDSPLEACRFEP